MSLLLLSVCVFVVSGLAAVFAQRSARLATGLGVTGAVAGATIGLIPSLRVLLGGETESLRVAWQVPYGAFFVEIDPLSAWFLLPILGLSAVAAIYGAEYLMAYRDKKKLGAPWFFFNLLAASMVMVVVARNGVLFLVSWEVMSLASFFLVTFEDEEEKVREAGWTYLVATHLGTAFLLALFVLLGRELALWTSINLAPQARWLRRPPACCLYSRSSASARRRDSCRSTSGCPKPTLQRRAMYPQSCRA